MQCGSEEKLSIKIWLVNLAKSKWGNSNVSVLNFFSLIITLFLGRDFPHCSFCKEPACNAGDPGLIPGWGRSAGEGIGYPLQYSWASLVVQTVKNLPATRETWVRSLGWEDPLQKGKATHSSILAWRIPWTVDSPWGRKYLGLKDRVSTVHLQRNGSENTHTDDEPSEWKVSAGKFAEGFLWFCYKFQTLPG